MPLLLRFVRHDLPTLSQTDQQREPPAVVRAVPLDPPSTRAGERPCQVDEDSTAQGLVERVIQGTEWTTTKPGITVYIFD